jgi:hypothetical protein
MKPSGALRRVTELRRRKPLAGRSKRGYNYHRDYMAQSLLVKRRSGGFCEIIALHDCLGQATRFPHHRKLRSQGGSNDLDNLLDVCVNGHYWIHRELPRAHAEALGLIIPRDQPVTPYG